MPGVLGYLAGYRIPALGIIVMGAAAMIIKQRTGIGWIERENTLGVRISLGLDAEKLLASHFDKCVADHEVISVSTAKQGAALDYVYRVRMNPGFDPGAFVKELNQIEGVQNVELRRGEPEVA
jgi:hypothetical protein